MSLIVGLELENESFLVCDSLVSGGDVTSLRDSKAKSYLLEDRGLLWAGSVGVGRTLSANVSELWEELGREGSSSRKRLCVYEFLSAGNFLSSETDFILCDPDGSVLGAYADGAVVGARGELCLGGVAAPVFAGAYRALSKARVLPPEEYLRAAAQAACDVALGAARPVTIWSNKRGLL